MGEVENSEEWRWIPYKEKKPEDWQECFVMETLDPRIRNAVVVWVGQYYEDKFLILGHAQAERMHVYGEDVGWWASIPPPPENK
jgi:hypothetical protein